MANEINDWLLRESGRISKNINQKLMAKMTPWLTLYSKDNWPEGEGHTISTHQFDRAQLVDDAVDWGNVGLDANGDSDGGSCIPASDEVKYTQTQRDFNLQQKAIWGPRICVNNLRYTFVREQQMGAAINALADQSRQTWIKRNRDEYTRVADNLVVLDSGFNLGGGDYDSNLFPSIASSTADVSILTNGYLEHIYEYLNHVGAQDGAMGMTDGRPVYGAITSARSSRRVVHENANIREDFRYSAQNEKLLAPMGVKYNYNGFSHLVDEHVNRWNAYGTAASGADSTNKVTTVGTAVSFFLTDGSTPVAMTGLTVGSQLTVGVDKVTVTAVASNLQTCTIDAALDAGDATAAYFQLWLYVPEFALDNGRIVPNSAWLTAAFEDTHIFHQRAAVCLVPKPITSVGKAKFDPVNYVGEFSWKNYESEALNPDGNIGRFRGVLMSGTRPDNPEFGIVVRHRACPGGYGAVTDCSTLG